VDKSPTGDEVARAAVTKYLHASIAAQPRHVITREQAIEHIKAFVKYEGLEYLRDEVVEKRRLHLTYMLLREDVFPQWGRKNAHEKMAMLGHIVSRLLWAALGWAQPDSRDAYVNKRMNGVNVILNDLFRHHLLKTVKGFQNALGKYVRQERKRAENAGLDPQASGVGGSGGDGISVSKAVLERCFKSVAIQRALEKAMRNGDFSTSMYAKKVGYCQLLKRRSMVDSVAHMNRIMCCTDKNNEEIVENRKFDA
jgi:DNA-directed RNA polymerase beta subunit